MLEKEIKDFLKKWNLKQSDIYNELKISKQNFHKALKTSKINNPTLLKILDFLWLEILILLKEKNKNSKKNLLWKTWKN